jgi:hypothetical protein
LLLRSANVISSSSKQQAASSKQQAASSNYKKKDKINQTFYKNKNIHINM